MKNYVLVILVLVFTSASPLVNRVLALQENAPAKTNLNDHWHQWRGPMATGEAPKGNPPTKWSESENVAWKVPIEGEGSSTPIIWGNKLFVISAVDTKRKPKQAITAHPETKTQPTGTIFDFTVICIDKNSGDELWKKVVASAPPHEGRHKSTTYASASPMTDGKHLYVSFGSYGIFCMTFDGKIVWQRDLGDMRTRRGWGEAVSPVIHDDKVIVMWDQEDQSEIFVLNASDGETAWSKKRDEPTTWATPLLVDRNQKTQVITAGTTNVRSYDLQSGEIAWKAPGLTLNAIPCPLLDGDNVICMSGYRGNAAYSFSLTEKSESGQPKVNWHLAQHTPYVPSPLLTQGRLYFTKSLNAIMTCVNAQTGETHFEPTRLEGLRSLYASPVATNKHIFIAAREGETLVIENSPKLKVVSVNKLDGAIDASPAIVGDSMFIRTKSHLYRIAESK